MTAADVAIVGGGFTGAVFAIHLSRMAERPLDIAIVEPRGRLGCGLAYDTADPDHRLNAPIPVHFLYPDAPDHLRDWYAGRGGSARDPEARTADGNIYMRRGDFGRYVEEQLRAHVAGNPSDSTIRHVRSRALAAERTSRGYRLTLDDGREVTAALTVLATGYDRPNAPPPFDDAISGRPAFLGDPWDTARLREIPADARILLLGMAQTASDVIAVLLRSGHRGPIAAVSRRGLRTRRRPQSGSGPPPDRGTSIPLSSGACNSSDRDFDQLSVSVETGPLFSRDRRPGRRGSAPVLSAPHRCHRRRRWKPGRRPRGSARPRSRSRR